MKNKFSVDSLLLPYNAIMAAPFGFLGLRWDSQNTVTAIHYLAKMGAHQGDHHPIMAALNAYFLDPRAPLPKISAQKGTPFQHRVWAAIGRIQCGHALTYGEIASQLASGPRAVGGACRVNPLPLIVPCHRVVAQNSLGGFSGQMGGQGFYHEIKVWLLRHEGFLAPDD